MPWSHLEALQAEARSVAAALEHDGEGEHAGDPMDGSCAGEMRAKLPRQGGRSVDLDAPKIAYLGVVSKRCRGWRGPGQLGRIMSLPGRL